MFSFHFKNTIIVIWLLFYLCSQYLPDVNGIKPTDVHGQVLCCVVTVHHEPAQCDQHLLQQTDPRSA